MVTLLDVTQVALIQGVLGVNMDGVWGPKSQAALDKITLPQPDSSTEVEHDTFASSFADPDDVAAFKRCKDAGGSDNECFKVGDNGIGCWGDSTVVGTGPSCALPPEYMVSRWGSKSAAKNKKVKVRRKINGATVVCVLKDVMPSLDNLANKARIDLNPDACYAINLEPPIMEPVLWHWAT
jgi:hypothetical protein